MNTRRVTFYVRDPGHQASSDRTITVALEGVNVHSQRELVSRGFVPNGEHAVLEMIGADPIFMWRVAPR